MTQERLSPAEAIARAAALFAAMTGARPEDIIAHKRGPVVDTARNMALHFLYEDLRYRPADLGRAMGRHASSVRTAAVGRNKDTPGPGLLLREALGGEELFVWCAAHWREPLANHAAVMAARRRAFLGAIGEAQEAHPLRRVSPEQIREAFVALATAAPAAPVTAVPIVGDEPTPMRVLRMAPAMAPVLGGLRCEPAAGGGHYIAFLAPLEREARSLLAAATRLIDSAGWPAMQRSVSRQVDGFKAVLHVAPAAAAALIAMLAPLQGGRALLGEPVLEPIGSQSLA